MQIEQKVKNESQILESRLTKQWAFVSDLQPCLLTFAAASDLRSTEGEVKSQKSRMKKIRFSLLFYWRSQTGRIFTHLSEERFVFSISFSQPRLEPNLLFWVPGYNPVQHNDPVGAPAKKPGALWVEKWEQNKHLVFSVAFLKKPTYWSTWETLSFPD